MKTIEISSKKYPGLVATVDDEDYAVISSLRWNVIKGTTNSGDVFYAVTTIGNKRFNMHGLIAGIVGGKEVTVDHIDGNPLNNTRKNLRICDKQQNAFNQKKTSRGDTYSRYKGVSFNKRANKWFAAYTFYNKTIYLGYFDNERDAALAYDKAILEAYGEYALTNILPRKYAPANHPTEPIDLQAYLEKVKPVGESQTKTSRFIGVYWLKTRNCWRACTTLPEGQKGIGFFQDELEAARAYDKYIRENGLNKKLNFAEEM